MEEVKGNGYFACYGYHCVHPQLCFIQHTCNLDNLAEALQFTGDTLREYTGYFTEVHYTVWSTKQYLLYKAAHGKKKWADSLCDKFLRLCLELEEILQGE